MVPTRLHALPKPSRTLRKNRKPEFLIPIFFRKFREEIFIFLINPFFLGPPGEMDRGVLAAGSMSIMLERKGDRALQACLGGLGRYCKALHWPLKVCIVLSQLQRTRKIIEIRTGGNRKKIRKRNRKGPGETQHAVAG